MLTAALASAAKGQSATATATVSGTAPNATVNTTVTIDLGTGGGWSVASAPVAVLYKTKANGTKGGVVNGAVTGGNSVAKPLVYTATINNTVLGQSLPTGSFLVEWTVTLTSATMPPPNNKKDLNPQSGKITIN